MNNNGFRLISQLLIIIGFSLVGSFIALAFSSAFKPMFGETSRNLLLIQAISQNVFAFILPAIISMRFMGKQPLGMLGIYNGYDLKSFWGLIIMIIIGTPALNQIIFWNSEMHLPSYLSDLEESWRKAEELNTEFTNILTSDSSIWGLLSGILVIGCLTGFSEELFFRGAIQGSLIKMKISPQIAIWVTAILFSLMHFQMFGFFPRMLLGAWFGYLFFWSDSIWLSATAHMLNNSLVVIFTWLGNRELIGKEFDMAAVSTSGFPVIPFLSAIMVLIFLYYCRGWFTKKS